jgi:bacterioferritin (cytochrome b1)
VKLFKNQIKIEKTIVESVNVGSAELTNPVVKGVLKAISLDSIKHAEMYSSAITLLTSVPQALTDENLENQKAILEKHLYLEEEVIQKLVEIIPVVQNEKIKLLLNAIFADEKKHHELLKNVLDIIVRGETLTEDDWWDAIWKNVPFHGAPGG